MVLAPEEIASDRARRQPRATPEESPAAEVPSVNAMRRNETHISNEMLLAAGGTVAGAAFLGVTFGGAIGAVVGAVAGLGVAVFTAKSKGKEGTRRS
jgi:hypothetical protein